MTTFTAQALLAFLTATGCVPEKIPVYLAPLVVGNAQHENPTLDTDAVNHNANGTDDIGLAQINTRNFPWLGLTLETARDPCLNLTAGLKVFFAKYNGSPPGEVRAAYASAALSRIRRLTEQPVVATQDASLPEGVHDAVHWHGFPPPSDRTDK